MTLKRFSLLIIAFISVFILFSCNAMYPKALVKFYEPGTNWNRSKYATGELSSPGFGPVGKNLSANDKVEFDVVYNDEVNLMVRAVVHKEEETVTYYNFLKKNGFYWNLEAVRFFESRLGFEKQSWAYSCLTNPESHKTWLAENYKIACKHDNELKEYFFEHAGELEKIKDEYERNHIKSDLIDEMHFETITEDKDDSEYIKIVIASLYDEAVGFLYCPVGAMPPVPDKDKYILVEKLTDLWYLYREN
ncbi:MAG: hypothetical protein MJ169_02995 [Treponema sp.]|nr:hypothetical protein [Treponema sp.]